MAKKIDYVKKIKIKIKKILINKENFNKIIINNKKNLGDLL